MKINNKPFDFSSVKPCYHNLSDKIPFAYVFGWRKQETAYKYDMHYGLEFGIVLNGKKNIIFPDFKLNLSAGNIWFCGMWEPHGWSSGRLPYEHVNLVIWPPALACLRFNEAAQFNWLAPFTALPAHRPQTSGANQRAMIELGVKIKDRLKKQGIQAWLWVRLYLMEAILLATEQWSGEQLFPNPVSVGSAARLNQVLQRFFDNHGLMTTGDAAEICGLNRNAFSLMFCQLMGLPFADFALRYRLSSAASCLRQTDQPIKTIALFWGFADTSHFDRLFAKYYGCTPHEYQHNDLPIDLQKSPD